MFEDFGWNALEGGEPMKVSACTACQSAATSGRVVQEYKRTIMNSQSEKYKKNIMQPVSWLESQWACTNCIDRGYILDSAGEAPICWVNLPSLDEVCKRDTPSG